VNCRSISENLNIFEGITRNPTFGLISFSIVFLQVLIILFGGEAFKTTPLTPSMWAISIFIGSLSLLVGAVIRLIPITSLPEKIFGPAVEPYRPVTKERLLFQYAFNSVRMQNSVFKALRGKSLETHEKVDSVENDPDIVKQINITNSES
jgi:hypothetical protein